MQMNTYRHFYGKGARITYLCSNSVNNCAMHILNVSHSGRELYKAKYLQEIKPCNLCGAFIRQHSVIQKMGDIKSICHPWQFATAQSSLCRFPKCLKCSMHYWSVCSTNNADQVFVLRNKIPDNRISYNTERHHVIDISDRGFDLIEDIKSMFTSALLKDHNCILQFLYKYTVLNDNMPTWWQAI